MKAYCIKAFFFAIISAHLESQASQNHTNAFITLACLWAPHLGAGVRWIFAPFVHHILQTKQKAIRSRLQREAARTHQSVRNRRVRIRIWHSPVEKNRTDTANLIEFVRPACIGDILLFDAPVPWVHLLRENHGLKFQWRVKNDDSRASAHPMWLTSAC